MDFNKKPQVDEAYAVGKASSPYVNQQVAAQKTKDNKKGVDEDDYLIMAQEKPVTNYYNAKITTQTQRRWVVEVVFSDQYY